MLWFILFIHDALLKHWNVEQGLLSVWHWDPVKYIEQSHTNFEFENAQTPLFLWYNLLLELKEYLLKKVKLTEQFVKQALISYGLANKFVTRAIKAGLLLPEVLVKAAAASLGCSTRLNVVVVDALIFIALI